IPVSSNFFISYLDGCRSHRAPIRRGTHCNHLCGALRAFSLYRVRFCSKAHLDVAIDQHGSLSLVIGECRPFIMSPSYGFPGINCQLAFAVTVVNITMANANITLRILNHLLSVFSFFTNPCHASGSRRRMEPLSRSDPLLRFVLSRQKFVRWRADTAPIISAAKHWLPPVFGLGAALVQKRKLRMVNR